MSLSDDTGPEHGGDDLLAAEYVLGVLPADEREAAAHRIEIDAAFARLVDQWEVRLSPMGASFEEVEPPAAVKEALDGRLFAGATSVGQQPSAQGLWQSLALWRGLTAAAVLAALIAIAVPLLSPPQPVPAERFVASLSADNSDVHYFAVYDTRTQEVGLSHVTGDRPAGQDFELWVIEGDAAPVSMGVIPTGSNVHIPVTKAARAKIESGAVLAISIEQEGGSPSGQPTGPVVAAGDLKTI